MHPKPRTALLGWTLLPLIFLWLAFNYLIGLTNKPSWDQINASSRNQVEGIQDLVGPKLEQVYDWNGNGLITFWFDDAWMSQYTVAAPVLRKHQIKAAIAIPTDLIGFDAYLSWEQVKRLAFDGWEISAHSRNHNCDPEQFTPELLIGEIIGSKNDLLAKGLSADHYVLPCGVVTDEMKSLIREHFLAMRSSEPQINTLPVTDPYSLGAMVLTPSTTMDQIANWIKQAEDEKGWLILMFHQIDGTSEAYSITQENLSQIVALVQASELNVVTPSQALNLVRLNEK